MRLFRRKSSSASSIMSASTSRTSNSTAELTGSAKLDDVTRLMTELRADLQDIKLLPHQRDAYLEQVKVYGRDPTNADPIFTKEGIETLTRHAFNSPSQSTSRNALRCLANAMLLQADTRQKFVDLGYLSKACAKLRLESRDDEFLVSRIIFLTTYDTNIDLTKLINEDKLAEYICLNIARHGKQFSLKPTKPKDPMSDMAMVETLKLIFNVTHFCPERVEEFSPALQHILFIINKVPIVSSNPLDTPVAPLINALINLEFDKSSLVALFPKSSPNTYLDCFIDILDKSTRVYKDAELEQLVSPLLTLLRKVFEVAPKDVKDQMRRVILPSITDREQPIGRAETLPSRLLRLSTNPATPQVRESISGLLFDMSDKDARRFVQNVGYGFASGFLFQHNVPIPENALEAWSTDSDSSNTKPSQEPGKSERAVNPVTGQFLDREEKVPEVHMTEEEKEREAERLFVLFERLRATGVVDIENPVTKAFQEGRFEELPDDA